MMKNVVILGGGSAGWITALGLQRIWKNINITVVEDSKIPPIIAGESGSAFVKKFYDFLDIDINDWVIKTNAMPKLGSIFHNWNTVGENFHHAAINISPLEEMAKHFGVYHYKIEHYSIADNYPISKLYPAGYLIESNKIPLGPNGMIEDTMYHFDSRLNADYLKTIALSRGITHLDRKYTHCELDSSGNITELFFEQGDTIKGDWFFDCSGFARLLLSKVMKVEFEDLSRLFPASKVVAWWDKPNDKIYTNITAMDYGWSWNINIRNRTGNGYIYDGNEITLEKAIEEAETKFNTKIDPVAKLSFTPSVVKEYWKNNVIGIGLSAGFVEPLESNGLSIVILTILNIVHHWNPFGCIDIDRKNFNIKCCADMDDIINFLNLHYRGKRTDTSYWQKLKDPNTVTDLNKERIELWSNGILGSIHNNRFNFSAESYLTVAQGLGLINTEKLKERLKYENQSSKAHLELRKQARIDYERVLSKCKDFSEWSKQNVK